jgi:hypothetical protein
MKAALM